MLQPDATGPPGPGEEETLHPERPRSVTILSLSVLIIAVFFWARLFQAVRWWSYIQDLAPSVSPAYLALTGLVLGLAGLPVAAGLWLGQSWSVSAARRYFIALAGYYWLDFLFFVASETARGSWPFALGATILILGWVFWTLARPAAARYFNKRSNR